MYSIFTYTNGSPFPSESSSARLTPSSLELAIISDTGRSSRISPLELRAKTLFSGSAPPPTPAGRSD